MEREKRLIGLYERVYMRKRHAMALSILGHAAVVLVAAVFLALNIDLVVKGKYIEAVKIVLMSGIPFVLVSLLRRIVNCERPYEVFDTEALAELKKKRKSGRSFPSRHVFSAFLIGTVTVFYYPLLGVGAFLAGLTLAVERVFLGIHFPKDVLVGAFIGVASGLLGILIL